jgi:hypothetical protein
VIEASDEAEAKRVAIAAWTAATPDRQFQPLVSHKARQPDRLQRQPDAPGDGRDGGDLGKEGEREQGLLHAATALEHLAKAFLAERHPSTWSDLSCLGSRRR